MTEFAVMTTALVEELADAEGTKAYAAVQPPNEW
jgi:hypothetical protein